MKDELGRGLLLDAAAVRRCIEEVARAVVAGGGVERLVLVGIYNRGVPLARRLAAAVEVLTGCLPPVGCLDITQYRDDLARLKVLPPLIGSDMNADIDGARVVLCDEVIFTGRSIRAALSELLDFGRPGCVQLAVLMDRGGRELPIQPDFVGARVEVGTGERVAVRFAEVDDGEEGVFVEAVS